jgi:UDP:flavonoid glycosyltransferase YjiC (YdhE family)
LLAWEGGAGRNHVITLKAVAEAISDRFRFYGVLCRTRHAGEIEPICEAVWRGPRLEQNIDKRRLAGNPLTATWGEYLGDAGFLDAELLAHRIGWWRDLMGKLDISLVIADSAPCAMLAARSLGIATVSVGVGYLNPPWEMERFPVIAEGEPTFMHDEADMVEAVNRAGAGLGVPKITYLPEIYRSDEHLVLTPAFLDPYRDIRHHPHLPPTTQIASGNGGGGDEVFVYFSTEETRTPAIVDGMLDAAVPLRIFAPGADEAALERMRSAGAIVEPAALPAELIASRSRFVLHAGQHGTTCLTLGSGLPHVALPQFLEQHFNARKIEQAGVATMLTRKQWTAQGVADAIRSAYEDKGMAARAVELASELRPFFSQNLTRLIRRRLSMV